MESYLVYMSRYLEWPNDMRSRFIGWNSELDILLR